MEQQGRITAAGRRRRNSFLLILTAFIWGIAFVAQSTGGDAVGPYSFNCIRCFVGGIVLLPVIKILDNLGLTKKKVSIRERERGDAFISEEAREKTSIRERERGDAFIREEAGENTSIREEARGKKTSISKERRTLLAGGFACGLVLFIASNLQQMGLYMGSAAGKAGFLTACYMLIVPVLGLFFHKKCRLNVWAGILIAAVGLYLLCIRGDFSIQFSDILLLFSALGFAVHILVIDAFTERVDGVRMSCIQFWVCGVLSAFPMFFADMKHSVAGIVAWSKAFEDPTVWIPILYAGVLSCGVAYTLQIVGQQGVNPTVASLLMSLESVFSVLAGWVILGQALSRREILGCILIFGAVVLAQIPPLGSGSVKKGERDG